MESGSFEEYRKFIVSVRDRYFGISIMETLTFLQYIALFVVDKIRINFKFTKVFESRYSIDVTRVRSFEEMWIDIRGCFHQVYAVILNKPLSNLCIGNKELRDAEVDKRVKLIDNCHKIHDDYHDYMIQLTEEVENFYNNICYPLQSILRILYMVERCDFGGGPIDQQVRLYKEWDVMGGGDISELFRLPKYLHEYPVESDIAKRNVDKAEVFRTSLVHPLWISDESIASLA